MIPFDTFAEVPPCENDKHAKGDYLLDDFQLKRREFPVSDAVCGNLKAVFGKCDEPAHDDRGEKRRLAVFQVAVPGDGHEDIRTKEKKNGFHGS